MSVIIEQSRVPGKVNACWIVLEICLVLRMRIINKHRIILSDVQNTCSKTNRRTDCMQLSKRSRKRRSKYPTTGCPNSLFVGCRTKSNAL